MSLVENCARRQHRPTDLMREIGTLRERGYNDRQIGNKIGVSPDYVGMIAGLLERGEERLVTAVETGLLPLNLASTYRRPMPRARSVRSWTPTRRRNCEGRNSRRPGA